MYISHGLCILATTLEVRSNDVGFNAVTAGTITVKLRRPGDHDGQNAAELETHTISWPGRFDRPGEPNNIESQQNALELKDERDISPPAPPSNSQVGTIQQDVLD